MKAHLMSLYENDEDVGDAVDALDFDGFDGFEVLAQAKTQADAAAVMAQLEGAIWGINWKILVLLS